MDNIKKVAMFTILFCICIMFIGGVSAANWTVNPGNSIQSAVNNASNNDTIIINGNNDSSYIYNEAVVVNKKLNIKSGSGHNAIFQIHSAVLEQHGDPESPVLTYTPVFKVTSMGSGSTIQGFKIDGTIKLENAYNCSISGNSITSDGYGIELTNSNNNVITGNTINNVWGIYGIFLDNSNNNQITGNNITNNYWYGVYCYGSNNLISGNNITNQFVGIDIDPSTNNTITGNNIKNNMIDGIASYLTSATSSLKINYNNIVENSYGFHNYGIGTIDLKNNWWGSNSPTTTLTNNKIDIYIGGGTVTYNPWVILNITANPTITNNTQIITTDLTHNNQGSDISSSGHIPDGMPVTFTTTLGSITSPAYTINGKANTIFNRGISSGTAVIKATLNRQTVQLSIVINTILNVNTGNVYYKIQDAINAASNGNTIQVDTGTYTENIIINKPVILKAISGKNVNIQSLNSSQPTITINSGGASSTIQGFTITGATNSYGIYLNRALNCNIIGNNLISNRYGIYINNATANINFNRITGNTILGLQNNGTVTVNAKNNWWGSNSPVVSSASGSDIYIVSGTVTYNPWLNLTITSSSSIVSHDTSSSVTADLTINSQGNNTSSSGYVPNGISTTFTTTSGTITNPTYTVNGKAVSTFNSGATAGNITVSAKIDKQTVNKIIVNVVKVYNSQTKKTFTTIQAAINDSTTANGNYLYVGSGTYTENVLLVNKKLILKPAYKGNVTITASNSSNPVIGITSNGSGSTIQGFTIEGATNNAGISIAGANNCIIDSNTLTDNEIGIKIQNTNTTNIPNNNTISNNNINGNSGGGIVVRYSNSSMINGNNVTSTAAPGIILSYSDNSTVYGNTLKSNPIGIYLEYSDNNVASGNNVANSNLNGIILYYSNNNLLSSNSATHNLDGICLDHSNSNTVYRNNFFDNTREGILLASSVNNNITENNITDTTDGITCNEDGIYLTYANNNNIIGNTVTGNILDGIVLTYSDNNRVSGNNVFNSINDGILLNNSVNNNIIGNTVTDNILNGIALGHSDNNTVSENSVRNNPLGIILVYSDNNLLSGNTLKNNLEGIALDYSSYNGIFGNNVVNNTDKGIFLDNSVYNEVTENNVTGNANGIYLVYADDNCIIGNNVTENTSDGIALNNYSDNNTVSGNSVRNNLLDGIALGYSNNNRVSGNNVANNTDKGIFLTNSVYNEVIGNTVTGNQYGIYLYYANNNNITENTATQNKVNGITLDYADNNDIIENMATQNSLDGIALAYSNNNLLSKNKVLNNTREGILLDNSVNDEVIGNTVTENTSDGIALSHSDNNLLSGNDVSNNTLRGIYLSNAVYNEITENTVTGNQCGIYLVYADDNNLIGNIVTENTSDGIALGYSNNSLLLGNDVFNNTRCGIFLTNSVNNEITENTVTGNQYGIYLVYADDNNLIGNIVTENTWDGIALGYSNNSLLLGNDVFNNTRCGIFLTNSVNNEITENTVTGNENGIYLTSAEGNNITENTAIQNILDGITLKYSNNNTISGNNVVNNIGGGIFLDNSVNIKITENTITNNLVGIFLNFSPATINFNRIFGNSFSGLYNQFSYYVDATNNWWGSDTPTVSVNNASDICNSGGNVVYTPWLVLTVSSTYAGNGIYNITADLTKNNQGDDTSSLGHVPDGTSINFSTDSGFIGLAANIINGKVVSPLNSLINGSAKVTVTLDNQTVSTTLYLFNIYNTVTQKGFESIQTAIDDPSTSDGDIIEIRSGIYLENVVITKNLTIRAFSGGNVTLQASNFSSSIITINPGVTVTISDIIFKNGQATIGGAINNKGNLTVENCTFTGNLATSGGAIKNYGSLNVSGSSFTGNRGTNGGAIDNSGYLTVESCSFTGNWGTTGGVIYNNGSLIVSDSSFTGNWGTTGGVIYNSGSLTVSGSDFTGNHATAAGAIYNDGGNADINFNRIVGNSAYGLYNEGNGTVNITNNWWGTNTPIYTDSWLFYADIMNEDGTVDYSPWLVLKVSVNPVNTNGNSTVTVDLTHNSNGEDTSSGGHIPDNIPVNFTTTLGTINSPGYTRNGKAIVTFNSRATTSGTSTITVTLDNQNLQINITIDAIAPIVNASLTGGLYNTTQSVNLTASDNLDPNPVIYYTLDGSTPTVSSSIYTGPIVIDTTTTLKFMAVDLLGNKSPVTTRYYIFLTVGNLNTGKGYSSIQEAIDDSLTVDGDVIVVKPGTYTENIVLDKILTLKPSSDGNVIIRPANINSPVITINSGGSGSNIIGFTITGASGTSSSGIYLNQTSNCTIFSNNLTNNYYGLFLNNSSDNTIYNNTLTSNLMDGIRLNNSDDDMIYYNIINNNSGDGIYLYNSENTLIMVNTIRNNLMNGIELDNSNNSTVYQNNIANNQENGIKVIFSSADINFNAITDNDVYGLYNLGNGTINAANNWWGTNNPTVSSGSGSDINIAGGTVSYDPWLVLSLTGSTITVTHNTTSDSEITADLTRNNHGDDTSSSGTLPDGLPVNFTTTLGTITSTGTTKNGKSAVKLTSNTTDGATTVTATLNNQEISKSFHKSFNNIQAAVNDPLTVDGDVILVTNGTYVENIVINKNLTLVSGGNVTIQALTPSNPTVTVNNCNNVLIYGFTITGGDPSAIYINGVTDCYIINNTVTGNGNGDGIYLESATNCTVTGNTLLNNSIGICMDYSNDTLVSGNNINNNFFGIYIYASDNNTISRNTVTGNDGVGIYVGDSNSAVITGNDINNNSNDGIIIYYSSADVHFNRIVANGQNGLTSEGSYCNAINNWWGTNNPRASSTMTGDIYVYSGTVLYNPWLVLTVTPTSYKVADGKIYEATITADLNHNNHGEELSTLVHVPDGTPANFTTDRGNITNISYTTGGEASATLVMDPNLQSGLTNVTATVDGQSVSTTVDRTANAIIYIVSTAIDLSTGQPLNLEYVAPLNEPVSWVSVLWKSTSNDFGTFQNEVDLIVNGKVVLSRMVTNINYLLNKDNFSEKVFYNINFLNWLFSNSTYSKKALQIFILTNPQLEGLTGSALEAGILNLIKLENNFTDEEMEVIANRKYFGDDINTFIVYPGDASKLITFEDPDSGELVDINFSSNPISRTNPMIYANGGYSHPYGDSYLYRDGGYEGVRSFAIVTTKVTDGILQYWLDQENKTDSNGNLLYANGPMKAAYGTFLEALLIIYSQDVVADAAASKYNVTWSRTTPIVVSVVDDITATYVTGEMDHRMGMDVVGDPDAVRAFRFACSASFSPIEYWIGQVLFPSNSTSSLLGSVTLGFGSMLLNGEPLEIFESNGYIVIRAVGDNQRLLIIDPVTGIVRDGMSSNETISGNYCFSDLQTGLATDLGKSILDFGLNMMNILTNSNGLIDLSQLAITTKIGLAGFISSAMMSLKVSDMFLTSPSILASAPLLGLNVIGLAVANAAIASTIQEHSGEIGKFATDHQVYLEEDLVKSGEFAISLASSIYTTAVVGGIWGATITGGSFVTMLVTEGELLVSIRDHYLPKELWKNFSYHHSWLDGYEVRTYVGDDNCIHYIEIPKNPDGSLRMEDAIYI